VRGIPEGGEERGEGGGKRKRRMEKRGPKLGYGCEEEKDRTGG